MHRALYLLLISTYLISCDRFQNGPEQLNSADFKTVEIGNKYSLKLPNYMSEGKLHTEASLEFQNLFKETYVIVIDENINEAKSSLKLFETYDDEQSFVDNYIFFQKEGFADDSKIVSMGDTRALSINGLPAKQFEMILDIPNLEEHIVYLATFVEGTENVFMLLNWTLENRKERYMGTFKSIAKSFKTTKRRSKTKRN